jgi:hypothetical protein
MGLDMYLKKRVYIGNKWRKPEKRVKVVIPENQDGVLFPTVNVKEERLCDITEEVACWRKANAIHAWFVENVQDGQDDCREYCVSKEQLAELLKIIEQVLGASELISGKIQNGYSFKDGKKEPILEDGKYIKDPSVARELLPTQEGFFFGSTDYDQYYIEDLRYTRQVLEEILQEEGDYYYQSSW